MPHSTFIIRREAPEGNMDVLKSLLWNQEDRDSVFRIFEHTCVHRKT